MAIDPRPAMREIRELIDSIDGFERVYCEASEDENALPDAMSQFPAAIVYMGNSSEYLLTAPRHRHTYQVEVWIFPGESGARNAALGLGLLMDVFDLFAVNVTLGGTVTYCVLESTQPQEGPVSEFYGRDLSYTVRKVLLRVSEAANVTAAGGD